MPFKNWKERLAEDTARGPLAKGNPGIMQGMQAFKDAAKSQGALDNKTRELIALAIASTTRCESCIAIHAKEAARAGATREELLETIAMTILLNAGAASVYGSYALEAFDQFNED